MIPPSERSGNGQPRPPERPGKYPLDIQMIQIGLISEQAATVSTLPWTLDIGASTPGRDFLGDICDAHISVGKVYEDMMKPATEARRDFRTWIDFLKPQKGFVSAEEGQHLTRLFQEKGYSSAKYTRTRGGEESGMGGITFDLGKMKVCIDLGYLGPEEVRKGYKEGQKRAQEEKQWSSEAHRQWTLNFYEESMKNPELRNSFSVSVENSQPELERPLRKIPLDESTLRVALELNALMAQEFHLMINELKGVTPDQKTLVIKPAALGADERISQDIAKTNAPISREMALPREVTFEQIAGYENEVANLQDIAFMLKEKDPHAPKGILLYGPPGTGKTTMAKAFASECRDFATFTPIEMGGIFTSYIHESANKLKKFLEDAQKKTYDAGKSTTIVFLDELEAVATTIEDARAGAGVDDRKEVRKVLLEWLDGIRNIKNPWDSVPVFMIGATNFKETIDEALTRSGRMEEHIYMGEPSPDGLGKIMQLKASEVDFVDPNINWSELSHKMHGASGADVESLLRRAYRIAVTRAKRTGGEPRKVTEADIISVLPQIQEARKRKKEEIEIKKGQLGFQTGK